VGGGKKRELDFGVERDQGRGGGAPTSFLGFPGEKEHGQAGGLRENRRRGGSTFDRKAW